MTCPNCGQSVSPSTLATCPHCGYDFAATSTSLPEIGATPTNEMPPSPISQPQQDEPVAPPVYPYPYAPYPAGPYPAGAYMVPQRQRTSRRKIALWIAGGSAAVVLLCIVSCAAFGIAAGNGRTVTSVITVASGNSTTQYTSFFTDPMTKPKYHWANDTRCFFSSDGYHDTGYTCYAPVGNIANGIISADTTQIAGSIDEPYGIIFRRTSLGNQYVFDITSDGYWHFGKDSNDKYTEIVPYVPNTAIHQGLKATNSLKVIMNGANFTFFINGVQVGQTNDTSYATGKCGVTTVTQIESVFTNFEVDLRNK